MSYSLAEHIVYGLLVSKWSEQVSWR